MKQNAFWKWFGDSKVVDANGDPLVVYHGTNKNFRKFDTKKSIQGIIWFSSDRDKIERGDAGAAGRSKILNLYSRIENPAGWKDYEKFGLYQIERDFDGAILPDGDGHFDGFVFNPSQLKSTSNDGQWNQESDFIRSNPNSGYLTAGQEIEGLKIRRYIPNQNSIAASFNNYERLDYVRAVPFSDFPDSKTPLDMFYDAKDIRRCERLAEEIAISGEINPLIVAIDKDGPYILEGAHRFVALQILKLKHFPALVVLDLD